MLKLRVQLLQTILTVNGLGNTVTAKFSPFKFLNLREILLSHTYYPLDKLMCGFMYA